MLLITNIIQYFMPEKGKDDVKINDAVLVKSTKHILNFFYPGSVVWLMCIDFRGQKI